MTQRAIDGDYIYFVTANVQSRRRFFVTGKRAAVLGQAIVTSCRMKNFDPIAYCILPNHFHLLVRKLGAGECSLDAMTAQRTLERVRCQKDNQAPPFLFPHRRLSSRRSPPGASHTLSELMQSIKGSFSRTLAPGKFWQPRSNFRIIDSEEYLGHVIEYIRYNYTKMELPDHFGQPPFVFINELGLQKVFEDYTALNSQISR